MSENFSYLYNRQLGGHYKVKYELGRAANRITCELEGWTENELDAMARMKLAVADVVEQARQIVDYREEKKEETPDERP